MRIFLGFCFAAVTLVGQMKDISGTWVAKYPPPLDEQEIIYQLQVLDGHITGMQRMPFGDAPIVDGRVEGKKFRMTVVPDYFGTLEKREVKGRIVGDTLELEPAVPVPAGLLRKHDPGGSSGWIDGPVILHRGTPSPTYRAPMVDYSSLPQFGLPPAEDLAGNGLAPAPPMGWSSRDAFHTHVDDKTVRAVADAMVASGMRDAGYVYVNIDDGWQGKRDANGVLQPNAGFPDMKALADYVHGKGLKLGIYSSPGPRTCGGFEGSYGHEELDAQTWAAWGIDFVKYDWCSAARIWSDDDMRAVYQIMGAAIRKTARPMVYSICQYGRGNVAEWGPLAGGNLWRTGVNIGDRWMSVAAAAMGEDGMAGFAGPGRWNDPDLLEVGGGGMTAVEYRTQFSLWAMLGAPLIAGTDVREMTREARAILLNKEVIAVDQDRLGRVATIVSSTRTTQVWARPLADGAYAVALFNPGEAEAEIPVAWEDIHETGAFHVRDLWAHADRGHLWSGYGATVPAHGVVMLRLTR